MPRPTKRPRPDDVKRSERQRIEVENLEQRIKNEVPEAGSPVVAGEGQAKLFSDIPISSATLKGLERGKFRKMTLIQRYAIPHALAGRDILGAAKTGSGKTLAFLIPLVERLFRLRWEAEDGLGGIVISPTRELALQIFEVLRVVATNHFIACGIVIGGKKYRDETKHIGKANILVCTPGRLLQHLEQTASFDPSNVQVLVLDEADRILDMGFREALSSILSYMPPGRGAGGTRQTMLFSATQTKSVKDLAKLSLNSPEYISVGKNAAAPTPSQLTQTYLVCPLEEKLNVIYSFIRSHLKSKIIIFFSSCKQVRFVDAAFRKLQPGIPLMCLHGKVKQKRRMHIYYDYVNKPASVLFATDIAARGLDFPSVDWVVQADCPENVDSYIHRVGRTARYKRGGKGLTLLIPQEAEGMVPLWEAAKIPIHKISINTSRQVSITQKLQAELAKDPELKMNAQKAFKSYLRSVHLQTNKQVFKVKSLSLASFASSLGLISTPRIKFSGAGGEESRKQLRQVKNKPKGLSKLKEIIKMEKESKRMARKMAKAKSLEDSANGQQDSSDSSDSSDSDDDSDAVNEDGLTNEEQADHDTMKLLDSLRTTNSKAQKAKKTKWERLISRKATDAVSQVQEHHRRKKTEDDDEEDEDDDILQVKHRYEAGEKLPGLDDNDDEEFGTSKSDLKMFQSERARKKIRINAQGVRKGAVRGDKTLFDDDGTVTTPFARLVEQADSLPENLFAAASHQREKFISEVASRLQQEDGADRSAQQEKVRQRKLERKMKLKALRKGDQAEGMEATLGGIEEGSGEESGRDEPDNSSDEGNSSKNVEMSVEDVESLALKMIEQN